MRSVRLSVVLFAASVVPIIASSPALAGGWDRLRPDRGHYLPGETAVLRAEFNVHLRNSGRLRDGPYFGYLLPRDPPHGMIRPPHIPAEALRLGALRIGEPWEASGSTYVRAQLSFVVPNLPSGSYAVGICNDPCRDGSVGWLSGGSLRIVETELEAGLMDRIGKMESVVRSLRHDLRRSVKKGEELKAALEHERARRALEVRARTLTSRLDAAPRRPEPAPKPVIGGLWIALIAVPVALLAAALVLRVRRRPPPVPVGLPPTAGDRGTQREKSLVG